MNIKKQKAVLVLSLLALGLSMVISFALPASHASAGPIPHKIKCSDGSVITAVSDKSCSVGACPKSQFFGLVPWYQYLTLDADCNVANFQVFPSSDGKTKSDIPLVLLAIVDDLLRIAGLLAVGFVIYGGIQYITSQGSPDGTAKAQSTVLNALIGLAIALIAVAGVSFVGRALGG